MGHSPFPDVLLTLAARAARPHYIAGAELSINGGLFM